MPVKAYKLNVVLLNYRTPTMVLDCLGTLLPQIQSLGAEEARITVVDNFSQDDSVALISNWIDERSARNWVQLLSSQENGGFAAGNNLGINAQKAEYHLLINSDTLVRENAISEMLCTMDQDPKLGLVSPRLEWPDETPQESCFRYHRPLSQLIASSNTGIVVKLLPKYEVAQRVRTSDADYEWTSFACVLIRNEVFDQIGLLDDKFFMYFEDVEFCYRAVKSGWRIRNHPAARVVHLRGGSSPVKSNKAQRKRQARYFYESRTRYFFKTYGRAGLFTTNILWSIGHSFAIIRGLIQPSFSPPACKKEWRDIWINFLDPAKDYIHPEDY